MGLREKLVTGELGVSCRPFEGEVVQETERSLVLAVQEHAVIFQVRYLPWRLRLDAESNQLLSRDIEAAARVEFEKAFKPVEHPGTGQPVEPRTRDAKWSPVVEIAEPELGAPALWVLRRLSYAPTDELVVGTWLLPVEDGVVSMTSMARDSTTGFRESALWMLRDQEVGGGPSAHPGQAYFDDARHDEKFPQHCLSRVRAARRWLEDPSQGALTITKAALHESGEQELPEADCAVVPPPRFARVPAGALGMSPTLASFTRVTLGDGELPDMLNVWKWSGKLGRGDRAEQLRNVAVTSAKGWENEGAKDIQVDAKSTRGTHGPEARLHIRFEANEPVQEAQIWFADVDGVVFRIGCSAGAWFDTQALWRDVESTFASFRRLSSPKKPWWKFGGDA